MFQFVHSFSFTNVKFTFGNLKLGDNKFSIKNVKMRKMAQWV